MRGDNTTNRLASNVNDSARSFVALDVIIDGTINGRPVSVYGSGFLNELDGRSQAEFETHDLPDTVDPHSIGAYLFTGYPNACRSRPGTLNPFVSGDYHYFREYSYQGFSSDDVTVLEMHCVRDAARPSLKAHFRLSGRMPDLGPTFRVSPIYELWTPAPFGLRGVFAVAWLNLAGDVVGAATAVSDYFPAQPRNVSNTALHRYIDLTTEILDARRFRVSQDSFMLDPAISDGG